MHFNLINDSATEQKTMDISTDLLDLSSGVYENDQTLNSSFEYDDLVKEMANSSYSTPSEISARQIKVSVHASNGLLNVHVIKGKNFKSQTSALCDSYVRVLLSSQKLQQTQCVTKVCAQTNTPIFDTKYSFEMSDHDSDCRLHLAVWNKISGQCRSEFLGCTSFSVYNLLRDNKLVDGWYHLLNEAVGSVAHSRVNIDEPIDDYLLLNNQRKVSTPCSSPDHIYDTLRADKYKSHHQPELARKVFNEINNASVNEENKYEEIYEPFPLYENTEELKNEEPIYESIDDTKTIDLSLKQLSTTKHNKRKKIDLSRKISCSTEQFSPRAIHNLYDQRLSYADKTQGHTPHKNKSLAVRRDPRKSCLKPVERKRNNLRRIGRAALRMFLITKKMEKKVTFNEVEIQSAASMSGSTTSKDMQDVWSQFIL